MTNEQLERRLVALEAALGEVAAEAERRDDMIAFLLGVISRGTIVNLAGFDLTGEGNARRPAWAQHLMDEMQRGAASVGPAR